MTVPPSAPMTYAYRAASRTGVLESGAVEAPSRDVAASLLAARDLFPLEITLATRAATARVRLPVADLAVGLRVLASLLEAGLPAARALQAMDALVPHAWEPGLPALRKAIQEGQGLARALATCGLTIPPVVLGIVQAGEAGSGLGSAVRRAAELMEETAATRATVRSALAYPALLALAGLASVGVLVGIVIPRFAAILSDLGQALPPTTQFVLDAAAALRTGVLPGLGAALLLGIVWRVWTASESGCRQWHGWLLRLPIVGSIRRAAATARVATALAALLESGVPVASALLHVSNTASDAAVTARLLATRERVVTGERISQALVATEALTPTAVRLVRAGEETGRLAAMLAHAARLERERADQAVKGAVRLLEPGLIVIFGGLVALVAAALLQAIYSVRPAP